MKPKTGCLAIAVAIAATICPADTDLLKEPASPRITIGSLDLDPKDVVSLTVSGPSLARCCGRVLM